MSKHSRNRDARAFQTAKEREESGFSRILRETLGSESQLPFGHCCLSMKPVTGKGTKCVASPYGHLFDRDAILQYIVAQKGELQEKLLAWERDRRRTEANEARREEEVERANLEAFDRQEMGETSTSGNGTGNLKSRKRVLTEMQAKDSLKVQRGKNFWTAEDAPDQQLAKRAKIAVAVSSGSSSASSSAASSAASSASAASSVSVSWAHSSAQLDNLVKPSDADKPPSTQTTCPLTGKKLRMKDLVEVNLDLTDRDAVRDGAGYSPGREREDDEGDGSPRSPKQKGLTLTTDVSGHGMFCCALTRKPITHQKVCLIRVSGRVCLRKALEEAKVFQSFEKARRLKEKKAKGSAITEAEKNDPDAVPRCPITSMKMKGLNLDTDKEKAIIDLVEGFTGFSSHNKVTAQSFSHMTSGFADARDRGGSLGAKGTKF